MDLGSIEVDPALLAGGVWWDFSTKMPCSPKTQPHATHLCFLVAPMGVEFFRALDELRQPHLADLRKDDALAQQLRGEALAKTVLRDWRNAELAGKPLPYSKDKAIELLRDPRWIILAKFIENAASNEHALLAREEHDAAGN